MSQRITATVMSESFRQASADDGVVDGPEMERAVGHRNPQKSAPRQSAMVDAMLASTREGIRFTERARAVAFSHTNPGGGEALALPPAFRASSRESAATNRALGSLDKLLHEWSLQSMRDRPLSGNHIGDVVYLARAAVVDSEHPTHVARYVGARLVQARRAVSGLGGASEEAVASIDAALEAIGADPNSVDASVWLSPDDFMRGTRDSRGSAGRAVNLSEPAQWQDLVTGDPNDRNVLGSYAMRDDELFVDMVAYINDAIQDRMLDSTDAEYIVSELERAYDAFRPRSKLSNPILSQFWEDEERVPEPRVWSQKFSEHSLTEFSAAISQLDAGLISDEAYQILSSWVQHVRSEGRSSSAFGKRRTQSSLRTPYEPHGGRTAAVSVNHPASINVFAAPSPRAAQIASISSDVAMSPMDRIRALSRIAAEAQGQLLGSLQHLEMNDEVMRFTSNAVSRTVSEASLRGTFSMAGDSSSSHQASSSDSGRAWSIMLLGYGSSSSEGSASGSGQSSTRAQGLVSGSQRTVEYVGTRYKLTLSSGDTDTRQRFADTIQREIAGPLQDMHAALSAIIPELSDQTAEDRVLMEHIHQQLEWAASTEIFVDVKVPSERSVYLGPARGRSGERDRTLPVVRRFVYPRALGPNR